jgi:hypothetical protein
MQSFNLLINLAKGMPTLALREKGEKRHYAQ